MTQKVELYTLLKTFSQKNYTAVIETETFIKFMEKNAQREDAAALNIVDWKTDTRGKIQRGLGELLQQKKILLDGNGEGQKIILLSFYTDIISKYFALQDPKISAPFPNDQVLRTAIPESIVKTVSVESGLINFLSQPFENPSQIVRIIFPDQYGIGYTLESQYPTQVLEFALGIVERTLRSRVDLEFYSQKMMSHFKGQEVRIRNFISLLTSRPTECILHIEESSEFIYALWLFLCPLIKKHIEETIMISRERSQEQIALGQAAAVILSINNHYQILAINKRNTALALGTVYEKMLEAPFLFTVPDILEFKNPMGGYLNQRYTLAELDTFLKERTSEAEENKLPLLLKYKTKDGLEWYIRKDQVWTFATKALADVMPQIKNELTQRWLRTLREFRRESAMDKDSEFDELLFKLCSLFSPQMLTVIQDKKTAVLQAELLETNGSLPKNEKFFDVSKPIALRMLLGLRKEDVIHNCKLALPFWYSIGFLVKIFGVFRNKGKQYEAKGSGADKADGKSSDAKTLHDSARELAGMLVPEGTKMDDYLDTLRDRWNQLLDKYAQKKLTEDVHAIVKAHLNQILKFQKPHSFDNQMLEENAERVIKMNAALDRISSKNALCLYIKVYITKLLLNIKK